jgi:hypothetical protein
VGVNAEFYGQSVMAKKPYERISDGTRLDFVGINIVRPPDQMPPRKYPFAQNVRAYLREGVLPRATQDSSVLSLPYPPHSLRRLNDSTPAGPAGGFILVAGGSTNLYANAVQVDSGLSGNPISLVPFRPAASVQPWMYVGDSKKMDKVRSDGTCYKMGIKEPQVSPIVASTQASLNLSLLGPVTVTYWGDSPHTGPTGNYIWKFNSSATGSGPVRSATPASGVTLGSSLLFDQSPTGSPSTPMEWQVYAAITGAVNTAGTAVSWVSGTQFSGIESGQTIIINAVNYIVANVGSNTSLTLQQSAGVQASVSYQAVIQNGSQAVFQPALESEGYSDFNFAAEATLYVPFPGTYTLKVKSKDEFLWGIGNSATGTVSWPGPVGGQQLADSGQQVTALNGYPLIPKLITNDGGGQTDTVTINVTFSAAGNYPLEVDYDYWYHSGRTLTIQQVSAGQTLNILPIPGAVITGAQYRYVYRSSATGATSNPSPPSVEENLSVIANTISATPSTDGPPPFGQVDKIDFYRLDSGLTNYTYVGTGPNSNVPFSDTLLDTDVANNPILEFDNYEPFPSIDLPASGIVNVGANGILTWVSGTQFNLRWLGGSIVIVGSTGANPNQGTAYSLVVRPTSPTSMQVSNEEIIGGVATVVYPPQGTNLFYQIAEPTLAQQPLPYMWGPTDNVAFAFAVGDPLRPGTLYWSKGNNLDSAPDTNQQDVTSPSEPLQNGVITNGIGFVMSTERGFLIYPNFFNALATVTGTEGSTWTIQESVSDRGLYIPKAICVDGGGNVYFRAKDGINISPNGQGRKSITDEDLYNLFPHEGLVPKPVTIAGYTIWPPDDTQPFAQKMNVANGYVYYDYLDVNGIPRTLVYDIAAGGWVVDQYQYNAILHILEEGAGVNGTLTGNTDGSVRPLTLRGAETGCAILLTGCFNAGDTRGQKHYGDLYIEADSGSN